MRIVLQQNINKLYSFSFLYLQPGLIEKCSILFITNQLQEGIMEIIG